MNLLGTTKTVRWSTCAQRFFVSGTGRRIYARLSLCFKTTMVRSESDLPLSIASWSDRRPPCNIYSVTLYRRTACILSASCLAPSVASLPAGSNAAFPLRSEPSVWQSEGEHLGVFYRSVLRLWLPTGSYGKVSLRDPRCNGTSGKGDSKW